jgi:3-oxoacyl-(acyl-carrier-protein) synthase
VTTVGAGGVITGVALVNTFAQSQPENTEPLSGQYFAIQPSPMAQASTTGSGSGATFIVTFSAQTDQRVIWTGQEFATLAYVKQVTDPNVMDPLFISAWCHGLAAYVGYQLHGDKQKANMEIQHANNAVIEARKVDGNEGLTVNDVLPDWLRIRGAGVPNWEYSSSIGGFNWGPLLSAF